MAANRSRAKKEGDKKHQENQEIMTDVKNHLRYFPPHEHSEQRGPLTAEGVRFRRRNYEDDQT
jgi:hypothetical protein